MQNKIFEIKRKVLFSKIIGFIVFGLFGLLFYVTGISGEFDGISGIIWPYIVIFAWLRTAWFAYSFIKELFKTRKITLKDKSVKFQYVQPNKEDFIELDYDQITEISKVPFKNSNIISLIIRGDTKSIYVRNQYMKRQCDFDVFANLISKHSGLQIQE